MGQLCMATLGSLCLAAGSATCAPMPAPASPQAEQMSRVGEICHDVMGLRDSGTRQFEDCQASLSHSLAARTGGTTVLAARNACIAQGLKPNTVALSECELNPPAGLLKQTEFASTDDPPPPAKATKSYYSVSRDEVRRREQQACAEIGFDPIGSGFAECVANLQAGMLHAENAMH
jgi:hypothetical protein